MAMNQTDRNPHSQRAYIISAEDSKKKTKKTTNVNKEMTHNISRMSDNPCEMLFCRGIIEKTKGIGISEEA